MYTLKFFFFFLNTLEFAHIANTQEGVKIKKTEFLMDSFR